MKRWAFLFLLASFCYAQPLPEGAKDTIFSDFSGGLNKKVATHKLNLIESPDLKNVWFDEIDGSIIKRNGYISWSSTETLNEINLLYEFNNDNGVREFIVSDSSKVLSTQDGITYKLVKDNLHKTYPLHCKQILNKIWFTNGTDPVFTYDGTTTTVLDGQVYSIGKTPNAPRGKYIEFYLDRVWLYNISNNNSALYFSAVETTETTPIAIVPDSEWAFPAINQLFVGYGDGTVGTGMFVYGGQLHCAKERSIHTVFGSTEDDFLPIPTSRDVGVKSNDSIQLQNNYVYFVGGSLGESAVYESNVANSKQISQNFSDDIKNAVANTTKLLSLAWDDKTDYDNGTYYNTTSTLLVPSILTLQTSSFANIDSTSPFVNRGGDLTAQWNLFGWTDSPVTTLSASTFTVFNNMPTKYVPSNFAGNISSMSLWVGIAVTGGYDVNLHLVLRNNNTKKYAVYVSSFGGASSAEKLYFRSTSTLVSLADSTYLYVSKSDFDEGAVQVKYEGANGAGSPFSVQFSSLTWLGFGDIWLSTDTGQYISSAKAATSPNSWDTFNAEYQTNGGNVKFYFRTATSPVNITTYPWIGINDGAIINSTQTNNYIQWCATLSASNPNIPPTIDYVTTKYNQGAGSIVRPFSFIYKDRYWLNISTESGGLFWQTFVKSQTTFRNPYAWTLFDNHNFYSFGQFSDGFYAGGTGEIYKLDSGTNDGGKTIVSWWDTPDVPLASFFLNSRLSKYIIDCEKYSGANIKIGTSLDLSSFTYKTIDLDGSGRALKILDYQAGKTCNLMRLRLMNDQLDGSMKINNLAVISAPTLQTKER